jgi:hypothetical protein
MTRKAEKRSRQPKRSAEAEAGGMELNLTW